jgi:hypothetical protein
VSSGWTGRLKKVIPFPQPLVNIFGENNQVTLLLDHVIDEENSNRAPKIDSHHLHDA